MTHGRWAGAQFDTLGVAKALKTTKGFNYAPSNLKGNPSDVVQWEKVVSVRLVYLDNRNVEQAYQRAVYKNNCLISYFYFMLSNNLIHPNQKTCP